MASEHRAHHARCRAIVSSVGSRAGSSVQRVGRHRYADERDLHAAVAVTAGDRVPPMAQERLEWASDGAVVLRLRRPSTDWTRAIRFEPCLTSALSAPYTVASAHSKAAPGGEVNV